MVSKLIKGVYTVFEIKYKDYRESHILMEKCLIIQSSCQVMVGI